MNVNTDCLFLIYDELPLSVFLSLSSKELYTFSYAANYNKHNLLYVFRKPQNDSLDIGEIIDLNASMFDYLGTHFLYNMSVSQFLQRHIPSYEHLQNKVTHYITSRYINEFLYNLAIGSLIVGCIGIVFFLVN